MKKSLSLVLTGLAASLLAQAVLDPSNVAIGKKGITSARESKVLFDGSFQPSSEDFVFSNYEKRLSIGFEPLYGSYALKVDGSHAPKGDTAWEVKTKEFSVAGITDYEILLKVASTIGSSLSFIPHKDSYHCRILFFDAAGNRIQSLPLDFSASKDSFQTNRIIGKIPAGAVKMTVSAGGDQPEMHKKFIAFSQWKVSGMVKNGKYQTGYFTSRPYPLNGGTFSWEANAPRGTGVSFQLAYAPEVNGRPGKWTSFSEKWITKSTSLPQKSADKAFVRYRARLIPTARTAPELLSVRIGSETDTGWKTIYEDKLPSLTYLSETPTENVKAPARFRLTSRVGIDWATLKLSCNGKDVTREIRRNGNEFSYLPKAGFEKGLLKFVVQAEDYAGGKLVKSQYAFIGPKATKGIVTVRDDGVTLIDGKPFFPIGLYAVCKRDFNNHNFDKAFKDIKAGGFNLAHTYGCRRDANHKEFMDAAAKYGIKLFIAGPGSSNDANIDRILSALVKERLHPALMVWYIGDDTADYNTPEQLRERTAAVKAVAPHLITTQADPIGGRDGDRFLRFADTTDNFLPEIYPVRKDGDDVTKNCVAKTVEDMLIWQRDIRETGLKNRSSWSIIQYFKGWTSWKRFPTILELRSMTWASVIHGATGVTWYTYGGFDKNAGCTHTPETWKNICTVATELKTMSHVLCLRSPKQPALPKVLSGPEKDFYKNPSVTCLLKEENGTKWLFAVNSATKPVTAQFSIPGIRGGKVLFEKARKITAKNGIFTETFAPQTVHIYELK